MSIGSIADHVAFPENAAYAASKFGVRALHEVLRAELEGSGVRARSCRRAVDTPLWDDVNPDERAGFTPRTRDASSRGGRGGRTVCRLTAGRRERGRAAPVAELTCFIPLVDSLRCIAGHEDTWLVASIERAEERDILAGMLGCPVCFAEYPIRDGIVCFGVDPAAATSDAAHLGDAGDDAAIRLAAALDLTDARMMAVLHGAWGALAPIVRGFSPAQCFSSIRPRA